MSCLIFPLSRQSRKHICKTNLWAPQSHWSPPPSVRRARAEQGPGTQGAQSRALSSQTQRKQKADEISTRETHWPKSAFPAGSQICLPSWRLQHQKSLGTVFLRASLRHSGDTFWLGMPSCASFQRAEHRTLLDY